MVGYAGAGLASPQVAIARADHVLRHGHERADVRPTAGEALISRTKPEYLLPLGVRAANG